jgi:hypothetical protein
VQDFKKRLAIFGEMFIVLDFSMFCRTGTAMKIALWVAEKRF